MTVIVLWASSNIYLLQSFRTTFKVIETSFPPELVKDIWEKLCRMIDKTAIQESLTGLGVVVESQHPKVWGRRIPSFRSAAQAS